MERPLFIIITLSLSCISIIGSASNPSFVSAKFNLTHNQHSQYAAKAYALYARDKIHENFVVTPIVIQSTIVLAFSDAQAKAAAEVRRGVELGNFSREVILKTFAKYPKLYYEKPLLKYISAVYVNMNSILTKNFTVTAENLLKTKISRIDFTCQPSQFVVVDEEGTNRTVSVPNSSFNGTDDGIEFSYEVLSDVSNEAVTDTIEETPKNNLAQVQRRLSECRNSTAIENINKDIAKLTNGIIDNTITIDEINSQTMRFYVSGIFYQNTKWMYAFLKDEKNTEFFCNEEKTIQKTVKMMYTINMFRMGTSTELDAKVMEVPYLLHGHYMYIILPNKIDGVAKLIERLSEQNSLMTYLDVVLNKSPHERVLLRMPRLNISYSLNVTKEFEKISVNKIFLESNDLGAPLSEQTLYINQALHITHMEIKMEGKKRSLHSGHIMSAHFGTWNQPQAYEIQTFIADHPFVFIVRSANMLLTFGHVTFGCGS